MSLQKLEAFKPQWVKSNYIWYGVNSIRIEGLECIDVHLTSLRGKGHNLKKKIKMKYTQSQNPLNKKIPLIDQ